MLCLIRLLNLTSGDNKVRYNINRRLQANCEEQGVKFVWHHENRLCIFWSLLLVRSTVNKISAFVPMNPCLVRYPASGENSGLSLDIEMLIRKLWGINLVKRGPWLNLHIVMKWSNWESHHHKIIIHEFCTIAWLISFTRTLLPSWQWQIFAPSGLPPH